MDITQALVVDDSKVVQFKLKRMLEARGMAVDTAASGLEALNFLKSHTPHVIFMDCMMPDMDGYEATAAIRATPGTADLPVIMCTGHDTPEEQQHAREIGATDYMVKPFDDAALDAVLTRLRAGAAPVAPSGPAVPAPVVVQETAIPAIAPSAMAEPIASTTMPLTVDPVDVAAQSAGIAERVAAEVAARVLRDATASLSASFERSARDIAQAAAASAVHEARQAAKAEAQAARETDTAATESRLRETLAEATAKAEQLVQHALSQSDSNAAALQASVGQAAAGTAERAIREMLQPALDAAQTAHLSAQAVVEARLQEAISEAVSAVHESARRATREALDAARPELEQATRDMLDAALADASRNTPPMPTQTVPLAPPSDADPVKPQPAKLSRAVSAWLAGLSLAVLYLLVRSFY